MVSEGLAACRCDRPSGPSATEPATAPAAHPPSVAPPPIIADPTRIPGTYPLLEQPPRGSDAGRD